MDCPNQGSAQVHLPAPVRMIENILILLANSDAQMTNAKDQVVPTMAEILLKDTLLGQSVEL